MSIYILLSLSFGMVYYESYSHVAAKGNLDYDSSLFPRIVSTSDFVDKTLFIKEFITNNKTSLITAPPGFGKSTNLYMLKSFLEIEVNEDGQPITKSNYLLHPVKDTPNYKLFTGKHLNIIKETKVMDEQFGRTPVISVSFRSTGPIRNFDDALKLLREAAHNAFKQHRYVSKSQHLSEAEREYFSIWCNDREYHMFGKNRVSFALRELAAFVSRHLGDRRVFVIVDDHDHLIKTAMLNVTSNEEFDKIAQFNVRMLNYTFYQNQRYVCGGLISGVSVIPVFNLTDHGLSGPDTINVYRFLGDHQFTEFYGLTKEEVDTLLVNPKLKLSEHLTKELPAQYGGYHTKRRKNLFNLYSILKFIQYREPNNYWTKFNPILNLSELIKLLAVNEYVEPLLRGESIKVENMDKHHTVNDIADYRNILLHPAVTVASNIIYFLLEEGYLTYSEKEISAVKIPNDEIRTAFTEHLKL